MKTKKLNLVIAAVFAVFLGKTILQDKPGSPPAAAKDKAQIDADTKQETEFQFAVLGAKIIRENLKNPRSFDLVSAGLIENGAVCVIYKATNSFNAVITEKAALRRDLHIGTWNKDCAGQKNVKDVSHIKHALN